MPEFKRNFTAGKMNKDLNERLVPKGEYRDAMNIEVSTSEGSDVGAVQNILGNKELGVFGLPLNSVCVGTISDEKNDALYWFTTQKSWGSQPYDKITLTHEDPQGLSNAKRDMIWEYKDSILKPVFRATGLISYVAWHANPSLPMSIYWDTSINAIHFPFAISSELLVGMDVEIMGYDSSGNSEIFSGFTIKSVGATSIILNGDIGFLDNSTGNSTFLKNTKFFFSTTGGDGTSLNFDHNKIISGINIIDDMLFWSDGYDEPKKINISRSKLGTKGGSPTRLINEARDISFESDVACKKEHITVIRKAPLRPPTLKMSDTTREGLGSMIDMSGQQPTPFAGREVGDSVLVFVDAISGVHPDLRVGDFLKLLDATAASSGASITDDYLIRVSIVEKHPGPVNISILPPFTIPVPSSKTLYKVKIQSLPTTPSSAIVLADDWVGVLEDEAVLFERKFPRFACRYKYIDNEYSSFGPFSQVAFSPGAFNYQPIKAYNTAMLNRLKSLVIEDFVPNDIPLDVISVDILYKNEASPTVYVLDSLSPQDLIPTNEVANPWNSFGSSTGEGADRGALDISTESIYAALPTNQTLRSWDNVPKSAVAQEMTSNRIVYGNYVQGYDMSLSEFTADTLTPVITTHLSSRTTIPLQANRSVKSLRSYDIGVVWGDEYGRETPVNASSQGSTAVSKMAATSSNYLSVELGDSPYWAKYYKFYIKETSNEYYNLPVGRVYDAEDGNIWVAFPSVDRNKVQEDDYIILKKGMESDDLVREEARYKIVAIENEAPEFVKTTFDIIAETNTDATRPINSCEMWGGTFASGCTIAGGFRSPEPGYKSFTLGYNSWGGEYSGVDEQMGLPKLDKIFEEVQANSVTDEVWVQFSHKPSVGSPLFSQRYHVTSIEIDDPDNTTYFNVHLKQAIFGPSSDNNDSWITDNVNIGEDNIHVHFYKKSIKNKPQFDGRFFVKIYRDKIADDYLVDPGEPTINNNWVQRANVPVYSLGDGSLTQDAPLHSYSNVGNNTSPHSSCTTCTESQWYNKLKFGGSNVVGRWFIDRATFASEANGALNSTGHASHLEVEYDLGTLTDNAINGHSCDVTTPDSTVTIQQCDDPVPNNYTYYSHNGDGLSNGRVGMKGVWEGGGNKYIDLAYSELEPSDHASSFTTNNKVQWAVGSDLNPATLSEAAIVGSLKPGQRFQYASDPDGVIYRIIGTSIFRLFNFQGKRTITKAYASAYLVNVGPFNIPCGGDWNNEFILMNRDMHKAWNRRKTYRIQYEIDTELSEPGSFASGDGFSDHDLFPNMSSTAKEDINFLDSYNTEEEKEISVNPAIFETEPKESADLDIYYEASSSIPVFPITNKNKYAFIPVGSSFLPSPLTVANSVTNLSEVFVTGWGNISTNNTSNVIYLSQSVPITDIIYLAEGGGVDIEKDNGEIVMVKVVGAIEDPGNALNLVGLKIEPQKKIGLGWFNCWSFSNGVESNRIGDTFNNPFISNGVAASTTTEVQYAEEHRKYGLIYSGIYNSISGINELNQFIAAEKITKDINPIYGSIQRLKAGWGQGGDLIALCEDRVLKILANKDALYNADGNTNLTSTNNVLGQAIPYAGEYGISTNPESFASEAYRAYFTDRVRGTVMRLSMDGLTPISDYGMSDWFKDNLKLSTKAVGSFDDKKNEYNVSLSNTISLGVIVPATSKNTNQPPFYAYNVFLIPKDFGDRLNINAIISGVGIVDGSVVVSKTLISYQGMPYIQVELDFDIVGGSIGPVQQSGYFVNGVQTTEHSWNTTIYIDGSGSHTVSYKEKVKGWVSFKSFIPEQARSMGNDYYTFKGGKPWLHHSETVPRNTFYDGDSDKSWVEAVINDVPGSIKSFKAVSYEGSQARVTPSLDASGQLIQDGEYFNLSPENGWYVSDFYTNLEHGSVTEFVAKEGKWFGHTIGSDISINPDGIITNNYDTSDFSVQGIGSFVSTEINTIVGCMCDGVINDCYGDGLAALNYSPAASLPCDSGVPNDCCIPTKLGCIDPLASNFDPLANTDDGSCIVLGCIDEFGPNGILNSNYDPNANTSDGSCVEFIPGCTDSIGMFNFSGLATIACGGNTPVPGDAIGLANNYCCEPVVEGCIDPNADAITSSANTNNNTCTYTGCTNPLATNYSFFGSTVDGTTGNQADLAYQYGYAVDDGLCMVVISPILGCADAAADNYDATATLDDGSCEYCNNITSITPTPSPTDLTNNYFTASVAQHETVAGASDGIINISIEATSPFGNNSVPTLTHTNGTVVLATLIFANTYIFGSLLAGDYDLTITQGSDSFGGNQTIPCVVSFSALLTVN